VSVRSGLAKYRATDLFIWALILCLFETLIVKAGTTLFASQPYTVSLVPAVVAIVYMRWGVYGMVHAFLGGLILCLASGFGLEVKQGAVYAVGNLLSATVLLWLKGREKKIRDSWLLSAIFASAVAFLMQAGRAVVSLILGDTPSGAVSFVATDVLSGVFALVLVLIARRMDGVFEKQVSYLLRVQEAEKEARREDEGY
jgi:energy-converting hydrogenase Eha subunit A